MCMARTNIDLDEQSCALVMRRFELSSKRVVVNFAVRQLAAETSVEKARQLKGSGWEGDLAGMRESRSGPS